MEGRTSMHSQKTKAYNEIRDAIAYGALKPGERLVEREVCEKFGLGRTPLREALQQLQAEGYLDIIPNKGAIISKYSVEDVESILDIVAILESHAVEAAANRIGKEELETLRSLQKEMNKTRSQKDYKKWSKENAIFHDLFLNLSGNPHLPKVVHGLRSRIYRYRFISLTIPGHLEDYLKAHEEILKLVSKGNYKQAGKAMLRHILNNKKGLVDFLKKSPGL
jgi:DNA-binding GntR family transcriptional regulator